MVMRIGCPIWYSNTLYNRISSGNDFPGKNRFYLEI
jgi:hypothetical protein